MATVLACLVTLVVPYARGSDSTLRLKDAVLTLARHIELARAVAAHTGRPVRLTVDNEEQRYRLEQARALDSLEYEPVLGPQGEWVEVAEPVRIASINVEGLDAEEAARRLVFEPQGRWPSGSIRLETTSSWTEVRFGRGGGDVVVLPLRPGTEARLTDEDGALNELLANPL